MATWQEEQFSIVLCLTRISSDLLVFGPRHIWQTFGLRKVGNPLWQCTHSYQLIISHYRILLHFRSSSPLHDADPPSDLTSQFIHSYRQIRLCHLESFRPIVGCLKTRLLQISPMKNTPPINTLGLQTSNDGMNHPQCKQKPHTMPAKCLCIQECTQKDVNE